MRRHRLGWLLLAVPAHAQVFVDADASGANDGTSWQDAFVDLQSALALGPEQEIWVAEGTYRPSPTLDRTVSFRVPIGTALYGGFAGTETTLSERAGLFSTTVLTGDLAGDDGPGFVGRAENSLHVVWGSWGMRLDGFTIRGGNANEGDDWDQRGGGLRVEFALFEVHNCRFIENEAAVGGGGVYAQLAFDRYRDCLFLDNRTDGTGGALWLDGTQTAYARIEGCRFHGNVAGGVGGGAVNMYAGEIVNCVFSGNSADGCTRGGGAVRVYEGVDVLNCTIWGNSALGAGAGAGGILGDGPSTIWNSILWGNVDDSGTSQSAQLQQPFLFDLVSHSIVQGWDGALSGEGNLISDPLPIDADGADDVLGTLDDDLRLRALSPGVDAADGERYDLSWNPAVDVAGNDRLVDSLGCDGRLYVLDIGAYERQRIGGTTNHCPARDSSLGVPATLAAPCSSSLAANDFSVIASPVPPGVGVLVFGPGFDRALLGDGALCVGGPLLTTLPERTVGSSLAFALDSSQPPGSAIGAGSTLGFQVLYRDNGSTGAGFNLSDAVRCTFRP